MRKTWIASALPMTGALLMTGGMLLAGAGPLAAQQAVPTVSNTETPPEIPYQSVPNFFKLPVNMYFGEVSGVAVNSKGDVFVFSRGNTSGPAFAAAAAQLLEFDPSGKYMREIGKNLYAWSFAHAVRIDSQDNIWAADKGSDMVVKFTPAGRVAMVFGRKQEAGDYGTGPIQHVTPPRPPINGQFRQVTDMAWDPQGNTYISDGYVNSRVAKFDKDGNWVTSFGEPGSGPGQLNTPHSIAADAAGNIYVADRGNARIQVFDGSGNLERIINIDVPVPSDAHVAIGNPPRAPAPGAAPARGTQSPGAPWAVCITPAGPGKTQYLYSADSYPGRIYKLTLDGKLLGMLGKTGKQLGQFGWIHEIACPSENVLYVAELLNWRAQKLILHPTK